MCLDHAICRLLQSAQLNHDILRTDRIHLHWYISSFIHSDHNSLYARHAVLEIIKNTLLTKVSPRQCFLDVTLTWTLAVYTRSVKCRMCLLAGRSGTAGCIECIVVIPSRRSKTRWRVAETRAQRTLHLRSAGHDTRRQSTADRQTLPTSHVAPTYTHTHTTGATSNHDGRSALVDGRHTHTHTSCAAMLSQHHLHVSCGHTPGVIIYIYIYVFWVLLKSSLQSH